MKYYLRMSSTAVVIGALRVKNVKIILFISDLILVCKRLVFLSYNFHVSQKKILFHYESVGTEVYILWLSWDLCNKTRLVRRNR